MNIATLLSDPLAISIVYIRPSLSATTLVVTTTASLAVCPRCHHMSTVAISAVSPICRGTASPSSWNCTLARALAGLRIAMRWHGVAVKLELHTRRFRCLNSLCTQRIFCELLPRVVAHYARKTVRMSVALELIGFALGGDAGARLARELGFTVSPDILLRRLRQASQKESTPRIVGVDDFAFRRGLRYGTLVVIPETFPPAMALTGGGGRRSNGYDRGS
jgi:hypothetical protein